MFSALSRSYKGLLFAILGYSLFSLADVGTKWLSQTYAVYQVVAIENIFSLLSLFLLAPLMGGFASLGVKANAGNWRLHLTRGLLTFALNLAVVFSFTQASLTTVYTAGFTLPIVSALIAIPLYKEHVPVHRVFAIAAGFAGVLIAFQPWMNPLDLTLTSAVALISIPILASVLHIIAKSYKEASAVAMAFWPILFGFCIMFPLSLTDFKPIDLDHLWIFAFSGLCVGLAVSAISVGFIMTSAAGASAVLYVQMLWGLIFGLIVFGDLPDIWMLAGSLIIIASGIYLLVKERKT